MEIDKHSETSWQWKCWKDWTELDDIALLDQCSFIIKCGGSISAEGLGQRKEAYGGMLWHNCDVNSNYQVMRSISWIKDKISLHNNELREWIWKYRKKNSFVTLFPILAWNFLFRLGRFYRDFIGFTLCSAGLIKNALGLTSDYLFKGYCTSNSNPISPSSCISSTNSIRSNRLLVELSGVKTRNHEGGGRLLCSKWTKPVVCK